MANSTTTFVGQRLRCLNVSSLGSDHARSPWQELPEKWNNIKKTAVTVRQQVAPLQANEVTLLRQRCTAFEAEQQAFWERFRREAPFRYGPRSLLWLKLKKIRFN